MSSQKINILHVGYIDDRQFSGVATVVPNYLKYQAEYANVALLNLASYVPDDSTSIYRTYIYKGSLDVLEAPFRTPDLVVFHEVYRPVFARIAKELTKQHIPYIITPHVSLTDTAQHHKWFKKLIGNALVFNKFIQNAAAIHFLSESEKRQSGGFNHLPSFICNNGIELKGKLKKRFSKHGLKLIYVGRFEIKIKGIDRILDAVNSVQEGMRSQGITVDLYGYDEANNLQRITETISKYGIGDIVSTGGPLFGDEKLKTIVKHDCFIQLSRTEGQPLAIMEAMDIGMPCIVTDGTTFADIAKRQNTGIAVSDRPSEIGEVILQCAQHRSQLETMSENASRYASEVFSWDITAKSMVEAYSAIVHIKENARGNSRADAGSQQQKVRARTKKPLVAFGIMAHKNPDQLNVFIRQLLAYENAYIFVHIDSKASFSADDVEKNDRVEVVAKRSNASWGDISLIDITLYLLRQIASHKKKFDWVSLHSALDLAIRPIDELIDALATSKYRVYMDAEKLPIKGWGRAGGFERISLLYPKYMRNRPSRHSLSRYARHIYQLAFAFGIIKGRDLLADTTFYGGSQWFTIHLDIVQDILNYLEKHPKYHSFFEGTLMSDEIFFPTLIDIIYGSEQQAITFSDNLRYIDWSQTKESEIGAPRTLTTEDIPRIAGSKKFFARKFDTSVDPGVILHFERSVLRIEQEK